MLKVRISVIGTRNFRRDCVRIRWRLRRLINDRRARTERNSRVKQTACPRPAAPFESGRGEIERDER